MRLMRLRLGRRLARGVPTVGSPARSWSRGAIAVCPWRLRRDGTAVGDGSAGGGRDDHGREPHRARQPGPIVDSEPRPRLITATVARRHPRPQSRSSRAGRETTPIMSGSTPSGGRLGPRRSAGRQRPEEGVDPRPQEGGNPRPTAASPHVNAETINSRCSRPCAAAVPAAGLARSGRATRRTSTSEAVASLRRPRR